MKGKTITYAVAKELGYKYFIKKYDNQIQNLADVTEENISEFKNGVYELCGNETVCFQVSPQDIAEAIESLAECQQDYGDEDGQLMDDVQDVFRENPTPFEALACALNERFEKMRFHMTCGVYVSFI
jgi:hypothetical protein